MTKLLKNKTALITGASRGIGGSIAIELARGGADIVINYNSNDEKGLQVKQEIASLGQKCILAKADLSQPDCAQEILKCVDEVDILVLNASMQQRRKWDAIKVEEFDRQINCNLRSAYLLIQAYAPKMEKKHWGRIITIGSVQERKPHPDMLVYSASKAALTAMAKSLALQLAPSGVTVYSIAPGVILTDRNTDALKDAEYGRQTLEKIPGGRFGMPQDCAGLAAFLCTDAAEYITGQNIYIDGGMGIK